MSGWRSYFKTDIGILEIRADEKNLTSVEFLFTNDIELTDEYSNDVTREALYQLKAYFGGNLTKFDLPLKQEGTDFQLKVWRQLAEIPFGKTISYGELARRLGDKNYVRAVGSANGKNPFAIIVPCHRVIGSGGSLVGYAGGLQRKKWLLDYEGALSSGQISIF